MHRSPDRFTLPLEDETEASRRPVARPVRFRSAGRCRRPARLR